MSECNCEIFIDSASARDSVAIKTSVSIVASAAIALSMLSFEVGAVLIDGGSAGTVHELSGGALLRDSAIASDSILLSGRSGARMTDRAKAREIVSASNVVFVADGAAASSFVTASARVNVTERASASSSLQPQAYAQMVCLDKANAYNVQDRRHRFEVIDCASASDLIRVGARAGLTVIEAAGAQAVFDLTETRSSFSVTDRAQAADSMQVQASCSAALTDYVLADDFTSLVADAVVWTCPVESFGMSHFEAGALRGLASISGQLRGAGALGVFYNDAPPAGGCIETGLKDFESAAMKRATHAYVGYSGEPMTLHVGNTGSGAEQTYNYPLPLKQADSLVAGRFTLGRGAYSRYWRLGVSGPSFELHSIELAIAKTSRKI